MPNIVEFEDAACLVQFDPATVVLNRVGNAQPLEPIQKFAEKLTQYVGLANAMSVRSACGIDSTTPMTQIQDREDAAAMLLFDPAAVVLRQVGNTDILDKLGEFASKLQHYVMLARETEEEEENSNSSNEEQEIRGPETVLYTATRGVENEATAGVEAALENETTEQESVREDTENIWGNQTVDIKQEDDEEESVQPAAAENEGSADNSNAPLLVAIKEENSRAAANESDAATVSIGNDDENENPAAMDFSGSDGEESASCLPPQAEYSGVEPLEDSFTGIDEITTDPTSPAGPSNSNPKQPNNNSVNEITPINNSNDHQNPRQSQRVQHPVPDYSPLSNADILNSPITHPGAALAMARAPAPLQAVTPNSDNAATEASVNTGVSNQSSRKRENEDSNEKEEEGDDDKPQENEKPQPKRRRRSKKKTAKKEEEEEEEQPELPEAPKIDAPVGYNGKLSQSQLDRSVGLTRKELNKHLAKLGLTSAFGVPVISGCGGKVSHMTVNSDWNILPYSKDQTFRWWLGEGRSRLNSALPLDPAKNPEQTPIPLFWAEKSNKPGGSICYYVGHFLCVNFDTRLKVMHKEKRRQALLEFRLVEFKKEVAETMLNIKYGVAAPAVQSAGPEQDGTQSFQHPGIMA